MLSHNELLLLLDGEEDQDFGFNNIHNDEINLNLKQEPIIYHIPTTIQTRKIEKKKKHI